MEKIIGIAVLFILYFFTAKKLEGKPIEKITIDKQAIIIKIHEYAERYKLDKYFVQAIAEQESNYNPDAINLADPSYGLMQLTMPIAKYYNKNIKNKNDAFDIDNNLIGACAFLADLFRKYKSQSMDDIAQMYNIGETKFHKGLRNPAYSTGFYKNGKFTPGVLQRYKRIKGEN